MRTRAFLCASLVVVLNHLGARFVLAEEGQASTEAIPTASVSPVSAEQPSSQGASLADSEAKSSGAPAATSRASNPDTKATPPQIKWRPLVLRSEVPPDQRPIFGSFKGTYLMAGANVGLGLTQTALLLGGEVSVVHQTTEFAWFGAYVDAVHDFGRDQTRFSVGPELGWSAFGLDAGYLLLSAPSGISHGITLRPLVSMGYVTVFGRFSKDVTTSSRVWSELGLLLKYPIAL